MTTACSQCAEPIQPGAAFCGKCGAKTPAPIEDAAALSRFRAVLEGFVADGPLDAQAREQLEALRGRLGLSSATRDRLVAELDRSAVAPPSIRLSIDVATLRRFEVGTRCMIRLRVENHGDLALERVELRCEVRGHGPIEAASAAMVFPGKSAVVPVFLVPTMAGYEELKGAINAVDLTGEATAYRFEKVQFRIGGGNAPRVQVVNIDQSGARVIDNSRSQLGGDVGAGEALVSDEVGEWREIALSVVVPAAAATATATVTPTGRVDFAVRTERAAYHVNAVLARGDVATVYGGERLGDGAPVAVKLCDDPSDNDLLQAEVRVLSRLTEAPSPQRKHLPVVLDQVRTADGRLGTVFEELDGMDLCTLRERLPEGIPERHLIWIMRRALSVLGWAHKNGILHGNIEPAHVVVRPRDHNVWLVDWCWAIVEPARTGQTFRCLNEDYGPPEARDRRAPLPSSDLYSLGKSMIYAAGGDPAQKTLPDTMDERIRRFLRFFVQESALGRPQEAWDMYKQADNLREEVFGSHEFVELVV